MTAGSGAIRQTIVSGASAPDVVATASLAGVRPEVRRRGRPRSDATTAAVLTAAYRLCARDGLRGATVQAIAAESGVSKMTIYKWWDGRLPLLIDAFLGQATALLPIATERPAALALKAHALSYLSALQGDFGRVQLAVLAACMTELGDASLFVDRYLSIRRQLGAAVIARGQADGSIAALRTPEALWDQIYGTLFYRFQFGLPGLDARFVAELVETTLSR